jgi:hypothetical protein
MPLPRLPLVLTLLFTSTALAGCSGGDGDDGKPEPLPADKGAISGLLINDVYRPVPDALILLQPAGLTATADASGQFLFADLEPGAYILRVQAEGHEAAPVNVDVVAGEYAESEIVARRVSNEASRIITTEYSVFIPCAIDFVASGYVLDCTFDQSGDSFRAGFISNYTGYSNATYLVTEMRAENPDRYEMQVREDDGTDSGGDRYFVAQFEGDYLKVVLKLGEVNQEWNGQLNNVAWNNDVGINTILFSDSLGREEVQQVDPTICCGAGAHFGIKAKFVQSLFLGEPEVDIDSYSVLA